MSTLFECSGTVQSVPKATAGIKTCIIQVVFAFCSLHIPKMLVELGMLLVEPYVGNLYERLFCYYLIQCAYSLTAVFRIELTSGEEFSMSSMPKLEIPKVKCSALEVFKLGLHIAKNWSNALD